jgi:hypothetical protein
MTVYRRSLSIYNNILRYLDLGVGGDVLRSSITRLN